jgi:hypothetical protein
MSRKVSKKDYVVLPKPAAGGVDPLGDDHAGAGGGGGGFGDDDDHAGAGGGGGFGSSSSLSPLSPPDDAAAIAMLGSDSSKMGPGGLAFSSSAGTLPVSSGAESSSGTSATSRILTAINPTAGVDFFPGKEGPYRSNAKQLTPVGVNVDTLTFVVARDEEQNLFLKIPTAATATASAFQSDAVPFVPINGLESDKSGQIKENIKKKTTEYLADKDNNTKVIVSDIEELSSLTIEQCMNRINKGSFTKINALVFLNGLKNMFKPNEAGEEGRTTQPDQAIYNEANELIASTLAEEFVRGSPNYERIYRLYQKHKKIISDFTTSKAGTTAANVGLGFSAFVGKPVVGVLGLAGLIGAGLGVVAMSPASSAERYKPLQLIVDLNTVLTDAINNSTLTKPFKDALTEFQSFINNPGNDFTGNYFIVNGRTITAKNLENNGLKINFDEETTGNMSSYLGGTGIASKFRRMRTNLQYAIKVNAKGEPLWNLKSGLGLGGSWKFPAQFVRDISMYSYKDPKALHGSNITGVELKAFQGGKGTRKYKKSKTMKGNRNRRRTRRMY